MWRALQQVRTCLLRPIRDHQKQRLLLRQALDHCLPRHALPRLLRCLQYQGLELVRQLLVLVHHLPTLQRNSLGGTTPSVGRFR